LNEPRCTSQQQYKDTGGQRVERAQMADLPHPGEVPHRIDNVV
jgi:hypothetical protein